MPMRGTVLIDGGGLEGGVTNSLSSIAVPEKSGKEVEKKRYLYMKSVYNIA